MPFLVYWNRIFKKFKLHSVQKGEAIADVNSTGVENRTALHWAVHENKIEAAKVLLKCHASVDAKTVHSSTPLHIACILGEYAMCELLLSAGASVSAQDFEKNTPVHYAAFYSKLYLLFYE